MRVRLLRLGAFGLQRQSVVRMEAERHVGDPLGISRCTEDLALVVCKLFDPALDLPAVREAQCLAIRARLQGRLTTGLQPTVTLEAMA